jgi:hypothetical protein
MNSIPHFAFVHGTGNLIASLRLLTAATANSPVTPTQPADAVSFDHLVGVGGDKYSRTFASS